MDNQEYLRQFRMKVIRRRIPAGGSMALTHRCNLRCCHCYVASDPDEGKREELPTDRILRIIDEIVEAGCLDLLLTGGEPLLRKDFPEIYRYARSKGLLVTLFTNGTLITDTLVKLLKDFPPRSIEITLYGATASTHENITGVQGSYEQCMQGISRLLRANIRLKLKTILMTLNSCEFFDIEKMAKRMGVGFRFDAAIFPRLNGDKAPAMLRVSPGEAVTMESSDETRLALWRKQSDRFDKTVPSGSLYLCGAGITGFHVDPYGYLQPCLLTTSIRYDLLKGNFEEGWNGSIGRILDPKISLNSDCSECNKQMYCGYCPAFFKLETGEERKRSEFLCSIGQLRYCMLKDNIKE